MLAAFQPDGFPHLCLPPPLKPTPNWEESKPVIGVLINIGYKLRHHHRLASVSPSLRWQPWYLPGIHVEDHDDELLASDCSQLVHHSLQESAGSVPPPGCKDYSQSLVGTRERSLTCSSSLLCHFPTCTWSCSAEWARSHSVAFLQKESRFLGASLFLCHHHGEPK